MDSTKFNYKTSNETATFIKSKIVITPKILIICGSGLGTLADTLSNPIELPYETIPNFPKSTVQGHEGKLVFGQLKGIPVVCMKGRFHFYEGYDSKTITLPVRVAKLIGCELMIVTNAAGSINKSYKVGDVMLLKDHINFVGMAGNNPMRGANDSEFGDRFFATNRIYDKQLRSIAKSAADKIKFKGTVHEGVYTMLSGPNYESVAEIRMLAAVGTDAVGMSTAPEVVVAAHCGLKVFGFSLITNEAIQSYDDERVPCHEEVLETVEMRKEQLKELIVEFVDQLNQLGIIA